MKGIAGQRRSPRNFNDDCTPSLVLRDADGEYTDEWQESTG